MLFSLILSAGAGLLLPTPQRHAHQQHESLTRRESLGCIGAAATAILLPGRAAVASGGATAGKTTSIPRAKIRYYTRVAACVGAHNGLEKVIASGDSASIKKAKGTFWNDSEEAPAEELKSAGYLLAVAFKIDSKIPPDKIPAVKEYKKMMSDLEKLKSAMSGGKASEATKAYAKSKTSLNSYLEIVELPSTADPRFADPSACYFKCDE